MFKDREDAGRKLAAALEKYEGRDDVTVVALPRGGVVLGRIVADAIKAPLDLVVPRKIGAPGNPEYAIGAITETGEAVWNEREKDEAGPEFIEAEVGKELAEARRRLVSYRSGLPPRDLKGRTVIIVDDGIATGHTMLAAVATVKREGARKIVVAVPVAPPDSAGIVASGVDAFVSLLQPEFLSAIGGFYDEFGQVDDRTVISLMER